MPKEFYTEKDIEDLVKRGVLSLDIHDDSVLTDLAYEKANRLGMKLNRSRPDNPPGAPVRPYVSEHTGTRAAATSPVLGPTASSASHGDLSGAIRSSVLAKLGAQVDPALLDSIIERVLKSTGLK